MKNWDETRLDEELNALMNEMPEHTDMEMKIMKSINKRIRKSVFQVFTAIALILAVLFLIISPVMNHAFFNPYELNRGEEQKMLEVMRDYYEIDRPGREVVDLTVEKKGFSRYKIAMQIIDVTEQYVFGNKNVWLDVDMGKYKNITQSGTEFYPLIGRFQGTLYPDQAERIKQIRELPQSARIYLSVSDTELKKVEELRNSGIQLTWVQVHQPNVDYEGGLSLQPRSLFEETDNRYKLTEEELIEVYCENLKNLIDHEEVWRQLDFNQDQCNPNVPRSRIKLEDTYKDAKTMTVLQTKRYCLYGKRDEILKFLEKNTLDSICVDNVILW